MDSDTLSLILSLVFILKCLENWTGVNVIYNNTNLLVNTNAIPEFHSVAVKILACECKSIRVFRV